MSEHKTAAHEGGSVVVKEVPVIKVHTPHPFAVSSVCIVLPLTCVFARRLMRDAGGDQGGPCRGAKDRACSSGGDQGGADRGDQVR